MLIRFNMLIYNVYTFVITRCALEKFLQQIIVMTKSGELLLIPLIPTDLFCFLCWWHPGDSFSSIDIGIVLLSTHVFPFSFHV